MPDLEESELISPDKIYYIDLDDSSESCKIISSVCESDGNNSEQSDGTSNMHIKEINWNSYATGLSPVESYSRSGNDTIEPNRNSDSSNGSKELRHPKVNSEKIKTDSSTMWIDSNQINIFRSVISDIKSLSCSDLDRQTESYIWQLQEELGDNYPITFKKIRPPRSIYSAPMCKLHTKKLNADILTNSTFMSPRNTQNESSDAIPLFPEKNIREIHTMMKHPLFVDHTSTNYKKLFCLYCGDTNCYGNRSRFNCKKRLCFRCSRRGHSGRNCYYSSSGNPLDRNLQRFREVYYNSINKSNKSKTTCLICNEVGHILCKPSFFSKHLYSSQNKNSMRDAYNYIMKRYKYEPSNIPWDRDTLHFDSDY